MSDIAYQRDYEIYVRKYRNALDKVQTIDDIRAFVRRYGTGAINTHEMLDMLDKVTSTVHLFERMQITLHSGQVSDWKIDCDALTDTDISTLAWLLAKQLPPFGSIEGVPSGGLRLAKALQEFLSDRGPLLIVDDVCTTGRSLEEQRAGRLAIGGVIFSRGSLPDWTQALFTFNRGNYF